MGGTRASAWLMAIAVLAMTPWWRPLPPVPTRA